MSSKRRNPRYHGCQVAHPFVLLSTGRGGEGRLCPVKTEKKNKKKKKKQQQLST
jgi:hypothetical protein